MTPDSKRRAFALGAAIFAALLAWAWLHLQERTLLKKGQLVRVLAAKRYLPAYTRLKTSDLAWLEMPRAYAPPGAVLEAESVVGQQTLVPFSAEEPLVYNKLALGEQSLAAAIPEGKRALTLGVDSVSGLSGLLKTGDHVDLYLLHGNPPTIQAGLLMQDLAVLAVGGQTTRADKEGAHENSTVTLALDPEQVSLVLPASAAGRLHLALRAPGDERPSLAAHLSFQDALRRLERNTLTNKSSTRSATPTDLDQGIPSKR